METKIVTVNLPCESGDNIYLVYPYSDKVEIAGCASFGIRGGKITIIDYFDNQYDLDSDEPKIFFNLDDAEKHLRKETNII